MHLSDSFITYLASFITGDNHKLVYRKGSDLINIFNKFGCNDKSTYLLISRESYVSKQIIKLKNIKYFLEYIFCQENRLPNWNTIDQDIINLNFYSIPNGWYFNIENGKITVHESLYNLSFHSQYEIGEEVLLFQIDKMERRLRSKDFDGVITLSLSCVESLLLFIYWDKKQSLYDYDGNVEKLHKVVRDILRTHPGIYSENSLKSICSSFITIINSLSEFRNRFGDAHGRVKMYKLEKRHAALAFNSSKVIIRFLYDSYLSKKMNYI
jgi:hypothetical protein